MIKMKKFIVFSVIFTLFLCSAGTANSGTRHQLVKQGNKLYADSSYGEAIAKFLEAKAKGPSPIIDYNLGNAHYRSASFDRAAEIYFNSANEASTEIRAKAFHNLGNTLMNAGEFDKAVQAYINSLKINPVDMETKQNLEFALRAMQQQEQKQEQQDNQDKQDSQDQKQDQQQQEQQKQDKKQEQQQQEQSQQEMSKEDAMKILQALENDEKEVLKEVQKLKVAGAKSKKNNW